MLCVNSDSSGKTTRTESNAVEPSAGDGGGRYSRLAMACDMALGTVSKALSATTNVTSGSVSSTARAGRPASLRAAASSSFDALAAAGTIGTARSEACASSG